MSNPSSLDPLSPTTLMSPRKGSHNSSSTGAAKSSTEQLVVIDEPRDEVSLESRNARIVSTLSLSHTLIQDILCGRGGVSNNHVGNEWYRRLIQANRPLYRACPKHTKLLIAKAIVQAVEQQGGRFLEKEKQTGKWQRIEYKRAVDKTSQGLREREKKTTNTDSKGRSHQWGEDNYPQQTLQNDESNLHSFDYRDALEALNALNSYPEATSVKDATEIALDQAIGLPRKTSDFILRRAKRALEEGTTIDNTIMGDSSTKPSPKRRAMERGALQQPATLLPKPPALPCVFEGHPAGTTSNLLYAAHPSTEEVSRPIHNNNNDNTVPPPLSRLTSQVSDWLNSFWPVPSIMDAATTSTVAAIPDSHTATTTTTTTSTNFSNFGLNEQTVNLPNTNRSVRQFAGAPVQVAPPIVVRLPSRMRPQQPKIQIQTIPPLKKKKAFTNESYSTKNNVTMTDRQSPSFDATLEAPPATTELEQSVSATLLKLAAAPSRIWNGLMTTSTMLFSPNSEHHVATSTTAGGMSYTSTANDDKVEDLLDDYEETEEEARLRHIG